MLPESMQHPKEGRRGLDRAANIMLFIGGVFFLGTAVALGAATAAKELSIIEGEPTWRASLMSFFFVLSATECFTANITRYAGDVLRGLAEKIGGKARGD